METRLLGAEEAGAVLPLVKDTLYQQIVEDYRQQILVIFGIFDEQRVCGISALKKDGQVLLVYVMENCRRRGVGSMLLWSMYRYCAAVFQVPVISVLAPSEMTVFFRKLGMQPEGMNMSESGQEGREGDAKIRLVMQVHSNLSFKFQDASDYCSSGWRDCSLPGHLWRGRSNKADISGFAGKCFGAASLWTGRRGRILRRRRRSGLGRISGCRRGL